MPKIIDELRKEMEKVTALTAEQKEQAAKALEKIYMNLYDEEMAYSPHELERLQTELAKVNLAIQPIEKGTT